jgi:thiamine-monophosphate kinase
MTKHVESHLITGMRDRWGALARGIGDDAAVLAPPRGEQMVISVDTCIEHVHFERSWLSLAEIGYRAVTAALSDLAAMAASPSGVLLAIALPARDADDLMPLADGIADAVRAASTVIIGGNLSSAESLSITTTVVGSAFSPLTRSGVLPGSFFYVTGQLGGPGSAVAAFKRGDAASPVARDRFARPMARIAEARWLAARGVIAAIDISDGLAQDAMHLSTASNVGLMLKREMVPRLPGIGVDEAWASGEEYELLVASRTPLPEAEFTARFGIPLTHIGRAIELTPGMSHTSIVEAPGHDHFSG